MRELNVEMKESGERGDMQEDSHPDTGERTGAGREGETVKTS